MSTKTITIGPKIKTALPGPNAKRVLEGDTKYISPSYTRSYPLVAKQGRGLVITDVDMPRLDGIELTTLIKKDPRLQSIPVMIVSYKDREADRLRGLQAGANYYLAKGSFNDETFLEAVAELIGEPR